MEIIQSSRGGEKLCYNGFMYTKHRKTKTHLRWRCVQRTTGCIGSVSTSPPSREVLLIHEHNHNANPSAVQAAKVKCTMKRRASETNERPSQMYAQALTNLDEDARVELGEQSSFKKFVRRQRSCQFPHVPEDLNDLVIDGPWAETNSPTPEPFLIYDNGPDSNSRIIAFASPTELQQLANSDKWLMDGNFAVAPHHFLQLYVIRVPLGNTAISTVYALLQRKTEATYRELFQAIMDYCETQELYPDPGTVLCDFELAAINAIKAVLGQHVTVKGCFFHFTQNTWRKIQELHLTQLYKDDDAFKLFCGKLDALALLPLQDVEAGLNLLKREVPNEAEGLVQYMEKTYVTGTMRAIRQQGVLLRLRRIPPTFAPELWNVHTATINNEPRTNNLCEAWNNRFLTLVGHSHPTVWKLIDSLKKDECVVAKTITDAARGNPPQARVRRVYRNLQTRLQTLCRGRANQQMTIEQFLNGAGHVIRWKPVVNQ